MLRLPARLLLLVLLLVLAAPSTAPAAQARCAKGQLALGKGCVAAKAVRTATGGHGLTGAAGAATAAGRTALPLALHARRARKASPRLARALRRAESLAAPLSRALAGRAGVARAGRPARARAAGVAMPDWTAVDLSGGVRGRGRTVRREIPADRLGEDWGSEGEAAKDAGGMSAGIATRIDLGHWVTRCPTAAGELTGEATTAATITESGAANGLRFVLTIASRNEATMRARVSDAARVQDFSYTLLSTLEVTGELRDVKTGRLVERLPTRSYRANMERGPIDPHDPGLDTSDAGLRRMVEGTFRGPKGDRFTAAEQRALLQAIITAQSDAQRDLASDLLQAEQGFNERMECASLPLDPASADLAPGQAQPLTATMRAKDGGAVPGALAATAAGGTVAPAAATAPATLTFTMGDADQGSVEVVGTSRAGRAKATFTAKRRLPGWDVKLEAGGPYSRAEEGNGSIHDTVLTKADLSWVASWRGVPEPSTGPVEVGGDDTVVSGSMRTDGTLGTGTYACGASADILVDSSRITVERLPDGALRIHAYPMTQVEPSTPYCERAGYGGDYGGIQPIITALDGGPFDVVVTIPAAQQAAEGFTVPVHRTLPWPAACPIGSATLEHCSEEGDWQGQLRFSPRTR